MKIDKSNIIIGLLVAVIGLLVIGWTLSYSNVNINRKFTGSTTTYTIDAIKVTTNWSVTYRTSLMLNNEENEMIKNRVNLYMLIRLAPFTMSRPVMELYDLPLSRIQAQFDSLDYIKEASRLSPDLQEKLKDFRSAKITHIEFDSHFKDIIKQRQDEERKADSLRKVIITLKNNFDLIKPQNDRT